MRTLFLVALFTLGACAGSSGGTCEPADKPMCCQGGCSSDITVDAVCTNGAWSCPEGSVSESECPTDRFCLGPLPTNPDAGQ